MVGDFRFSLAMSFVKALLYSSGPVTPLIQNWLLTRPE
jgi:hypothetical protein